MKNLLITGLPGVGKTTLIKKIPEALKDSHPAGFYTEEIRERGVRKGFALISLDGRKGILSHIDIRSSHRVGKYGVDIKGFEDFLGTIPFFDPSTQLIVVDEIGKMECLSDRFQKLIKEILGSERLLIATVALKGTGLIEEVKRRHDVKVFEVTVNNREALLSEILKALDMGGDFG